ncbi:hypothetical protein FB45DRAFT_861072 [Roridomyces roridus]|uniref:Uncharacterized protein n=1 Tax=Roridomyces roridus TaxID=1738132 RepID=A0AAD7CGX3_9AGAR|nr:hypothetical protein FB45DRAFT_861072 [Roridomyces roridus]
MRCTLLHRERHPRIQACIYPRPLQHSTEERSRDNQGHCMPRVTTLPLVDTVEQQCGSLHVGGSCPLSWPAGDGRWDGGGKRDQPREGVQRMIKVRRGLDSACRSSVCQRRRARASGERMGEFKSHKQEEDGASRRSPDSAHRKLHPPLLHSISSQTSGNSRHGDQQRIQVGVRQLEAKRQVESVGFTSQISSYTSDGLECNNPSERTSVYFGRASQRVTNRKIEPSSLNKAVSWVHLSGKNTPEKSAGGGAGDEVEMLNRELCICASPGSVDLEPISLAATGPNRVRAAAIRNRKKKASKATWQNPRERTHASHSATLPAFRPGTARDNNQAKQTGGNPYRLTSQKGQEEVRKREREHQPRTRRDGDLIEAAEKGGGGILESCLNEQQETDTVECYITIGPNGNPEPIEMRPIPGGFVSCEGQGRTRSSGVSSTEIMMLNANPRRGAGRAGGMEGRTVKLVNQTSAHVFGIWTPGTPFALTSDSCGCLLTITPFTPLAFGVSVARLGNHSAIRPIRQTNGAAAGLRLSQLESRAQLNNDRIASRKSAAVIWIRTAITA